MINKDRLITILTKLLKINSANPPGNEVAVADYVKFILTLRIAQM